MQQPPPPPGLAPGTKAANVRAMFENRNSSSNTPPAPPQSAPSPSKFASKFASSSTSGVGGGGGAAKAPESLVKLFVGAKLSREQATTYAASLAKEGFDTLEKLKLVDESDLFACGITTRFDVRLILSLKNGSPSQAMVEEPIPSTKFGSAPAASKPPPPAHSKPSPLPKVKPPPGLSMMEEMKWRQAQANGDSSPAPAAPAAVQTDKPKALPKSKAKPPPGLSMMEEMKWKQAQAAREANGESDPDPEPEKPKPKPDSKPAASGGLADRQKMLANMLGGKGGGGTSPKAAEDKPKPAPVKKWAIGEEAKPGGGGSAALSPDGPPADLAKYEKMAKMLPQGAVENCMIKDGVDPGYLFEECMTMKSTKKPSMMKAGSAPAAVAPVITPVIAPAEVNVRMTLVRPPEPSVATTPFPVAATAAPPPLPTHATDWQELWSAEHNCPYYVNQVTGQSDWYAPPGFQSAYQQHQQQQQHQYPIVHVQYNFNPTGMDPQEMQCFVGDQIQVYDVDCNGWLTGKCVRTGMVGLIPQNYTA